MTISFMHELMNPASIAIAGAGNNPMKMGTMHALSILKDGYTGKFYPVHPRDAMVLGHRAYKSPADLPEPPGLAIFVLPAGNLIPVFEEFARIGTKYAIVITAGFRETGSEGREQEKKLIDIAEKYSMRFIGPNCMGIINTEISLNTTVTPLTDQPGFFGFASQSGTYVTQTLPYLKRRGIRFSKSVSVGNQASVDIVDVLQFLGEDEQTKSIGLYIEALSDPERFLKVAREVTARKPVVAQYVGGSEAGARSGLSHTGSMAGPDHFYDGLFKQAGVLRVDSIDDLYSWGWTLATQPPVRGNRLGIITNSGGPGSAIADTAESTGFEVPAFSESLQGKLKPVLESHAPAGNPVDLTFTTDITVLTEKIPAIVMQSGEVDAVVMHGPMSSGFIKILAEHLRGLIPENMLDAFIAETEKQDIATAVSLPFSNNIPMVISSFFGMEDYHISSYLKNNVPVLESPESAARAIGALLKYRQVRERKPSSEIILPAGISAAKDIIKKAIDQGRRSLDEYEAKSLIGAYGIPVSREIIASTPEEAGFAAEKLSFPVAVKGCGHDILHKTERSLVHLNLNDNESLVSAFNSIRKSAGEDIPVLVSEMVKGKREFLAGVVREKGFGTWTAFGAGGIFAEAAKDVVYRLSPLSIEDSLEMLSGIKSSALLGDYRGMGSVNRESLAGLLQTLSFIPVLHPEISEIDINPVIIRGAEPVVVDALITLKV